MRIVRELLEFEPEEKGTDLSEALRYLTNAIKKRCTAFLLSDMLDVDEGATPNYEHALRIAASRHDLHVVSVYDKLEKELPDVGLVRIVDSESGKEEWIDTSSKKTREGYAEWNKIADRRRKQLLNKYKIGSVAVATDADYVKGLVNLFKK